MSCFARMMQGETKCPPPRRPRSSTWLRRRRALRPPDSVAVCDRLLHRHRRHLRRSADPSGSPSSSGIADRARSRTPRAGGARAPHGRPSVRGLRRVDVHRWPAVPTAPKRIARNASSRSASSRTITALLPPSSRIVRPKRAGDGLRDVPAHARWIRSSRRAGSSRVAQHRLTDLGCPGRPRARHKLRNRPASRTSAAIIVVAIAHSGVELSWASRSASHRRRARASRSRPIRRPGS